MGENVANLRADRFGRRLRRLSVGALLLVVGAQGVFVFTRATLILVEGVSDAVVKVLS